MGDFMDSPASGADIAVVIMEDVPNSGIAWFHGIEAKPTYMIIRQDFLFDKYTFLHTLGHLLGLGHEKGAGKS